MPMRENVNNDVSMNSPVAKRKAVLIPRGGGGGREFPSNGLLGMCRWTGSHFDDSTDYNGVVFSSSFNRVTRMGSHFFGTLRVRKLFTEK